jgi:hypothetical protein
MSRFKVTDELRGKLETTADLCKKMAVLIEEEIDAAYRWDMCIDEFDLKTILFNATLLSNHKLKLENEILIAMGVITRNDLICK